MDTLKFAFDTLIVGALALPWVAVLLRMYFKPAIAGTTEDHLAPLAALPEHARDAIFGVVILALGYFLGSAVSRISDDLFGDDELWRSLPTEPSIREDVYYHEYCDVHNVMEARGLPKELGSSTVPVPFCLREGLRGAYAWRERWSEVVMEFFRLQEGRLLLQGEDKTGRLRELHDQIVILRGATLNGLVLSTLCLFGFCLSFQHRPHGSWGNLGLTHALAVALVVYGAYCFWRHFYRLSGHPDAYRDAPLAEGVMILVGIAGLFARARVDSRWKYARAVGLSVALTFIAYGAWWWTEVMYNQSVIHAYQTTT